jgi:hypothetical protein
LPHPTRRCPKSWRRARLGRQKISRLLVPRG